MCQKLWPFRKGNHYSTLPEPGPMEIPASIIRHRDVHYSSSEHRRLYPQHSPPRSLHPTNHAGQGLERGTAHAILRLGRRMEGRQSGQMFEYSI